MSVAPSERNVTTFGNVSILLSVFKTLHSMELVFEKMTRGFCREWDPHQKNSGGTVNTTHAPSSVASLVQGASEQGRVQAWIQGEGVLQDASESQALAETVIANVCKQIRSLPLY